MEKFTVAEAAIRLGVHRSLVRRMLLNRELIGAQEMKMVMGMIRPVWAITRTDLEAFEIYRAQKREAKKLPDYVPADIETLPKKRIADLAWLAGIVDGEGYLGLSQKTMRGTTDKVWIGYTPTVTVAMNSEIVCRKAQVITTVGKVFLKEMLYGKEHWCWRCRNRDAVIALRLLLPFLVEKPYQATLVLRGAAINASYQAERDWRSRLPQRSEELKTLAAELIRIHGGSHEHL